LVVTSERVGRPRVARALSLRALIPNAITALALCSGLTGIRYAIGGEWDRAALAIVFAAVFDVLDGRVARMIKGTSRFGAELDSLSDMVAFGVAPALIIYLWSLQVSPALGWLAALAHTVCCALRLARFNAQIDAEELPYKRAGFLTGIPAPAGAGIALIPLFLSLAAQQWSALQPVQAVLRAPLCAGTVLLMSAFLMFASLPSWSWRVFRIPQRYRVVALLAIVLIFVELLTETWVMLSALAVGYTIAIPFAWWRYAVVKARRARITLH
jgi:CDP-diacylglycerol--serine O-phosphatidyltransferase